MLALLLAELLAVHPTITMPSKSTLYINYINQCVPSKSTLCINYINQCVSTVPQTIRLKIPSTHVYAPIKIHKIQVRLGASVHFGSKCRFRCKYVSPLDLGSVVTFQGHADVQVALAEAKSILGWAKQLQSCRWTIKHLTWEEHRKGRGPTSWLWTYFCACKPKVNTRIW